MRVYHDWEFLEDGVTIRPISVGMVAEDGSMLYRVFKNRQLMRKASEHPFLRKSVLKHIPFNVNTGTFDIRSKEYSVVQPKVIIQQEVLQFLSNIPSLELWANFSAYDHVCLAQLFGTMIDKPSFMPAQTDDLQTEFKRLGCPRLPMQAVESEHHALYDAMYDRDIGEYLKALDRA